MVASEYPLYAAKIKVVERRWHGWSPEGSKIPPKEDIIEKISGSRLIISSSTHKMDGIWGGENQNVESMKRVDFLQKEGFRLFISESKPDVVVFTPERTLEPISGDIFPIRNDLPLQPEELKTGETFVIEPRSQDAGVKYEITVLDIFKK